MIGAGPHTLAADCSTRGFRRWGTYGIANRAVTVRALVIVNVHGPAVEHPSVPTQPMNRAPGCGRGVRITVVPAGNATVHQRQLRMSHPDTAIVPGPVTRAVRDHVGGAATTSMMTDRLTVPPGPSQVSV